MVHSRSVWRRPNVNHGLVRLWRTPAHHDTDAFYLHWQIYSLPSFDEVFCFPHFDLSPGILADTPSQVTNTVSVAGIKIKEVLLTSLGKKTKDAYLFVSDKTIVFVACV